MDITTLTGLSLATFLLALTPGPGVLAVTAVAVGANFSSAARLILGILLGHSLFILLVLYGFSLIASSLGNLFLVVKYLGSLYLIWIGLKLWHYQHTTPQPDRKSVV